MPNRPPPTVHTPTVPTHHHTTPLNPHHPQVGLINIIHSNQPSQLLFNPHSSLLFSTCLDGTALKPYTRQPPQSGRLSLPQLDAALESTIAPAAESSWRPWELGTSNDTFDIPKYCLHNHKSTTSLRAPLPPQRPLHSRHQEPRGGPPAS